MPRRHRFYFCHVTQQNVDGSGRQNLCFFCGLIAPKPYVPYQNSLTKGRSLGCRLVSRNDSHCLKLCRLSCTPITSTPSKVPIFCVLKPVKSLCKNSDIFQRFTHAHTDSRLLIQQCSKSVQDKWPKVRVVIGDEKHVLASVAGTP